MMERKTYTKLSAPSPERYRFGFPQKIYFLIPLSLLVIYSMIASASRELLVQADNVITPLVNSLHYIGLGVVKPFIDGPMPERYYTNLVGIGVWATIAYNLRTALWMISYCLQNNFIESTTKRVQAEKGWSTRKVRFVQRIFLILLILPTTIYSLLCLLNSMQGWLVFHVKDMLTPLLLIFTFQAPGIYFIGLLSMLVMYFFHDIGQLIRTIFRQG